MKRRIKLAIQTLETVARAADDDPAKRERLQSVIEVLYWAMGHKSRGKGFGKFVALMQSKIDQVRAELADTNKEAEA